MQIIIITVNVVFSVVFLPTVFVMQVLSNLGYVLKSMKNASDTVGLKIQYMESYCIYPCISQPPILEPKN